MSATNLVIVLVAASLTIVYATLTSRIAPVLAAFFARRLPERHVHTLACAHLGRH